MCFRLFSQIRKGAPLHDEWHDAFETGRFQQRQGRATLAAPLSVAPPAQIMAQQAHFFNSTDGEYTTASYPGSSEGMLFSATKRSCDVLDRSNDGNNGYYAGHNLVTGGTLEDEDSNSDPAFALLMLGRSSSEAAPLLSPNSNKRRREIEDTGQHGAPFSRPHPPAQSQAHQQAHFQAQLQARMHHNNYHLVQERLALQSSLRRHSQMQQSLQPQRAHEQMRMQPQMARSCMIAHGPRGLDNEHSQLAPFYNQNFAQFPPPGTNPGFYSALGLGSLASMKPQPLHTFSCTSRSSSSTGSSSSDIPSSSSSFDSDRISPNYCGGKTTAGPSAPTADVVKSAAFAAALAGAAPLTGSGPGGLPVSIEQPLVAAALGRQQLHNAFGLRPGANTMPPKLPPAAFMQGQLKQAHVAAQHDNQYHHVQHQNMQQVHWAAATVSVAKAAAVQAMHGQHTKNVDKAGMANGGDL